MSFPNLKLKNNWFVLFILSYIGLMLVFYPVSRMYANEYETVPIKFEHAFLMVIIGAICNTGLFLSLSKWGQEHKNITTLGIVIATLMNAFLLLLTNGNPLYYVSHENWNTVRYVCFYGVLLVGVVLCILIRGYQNESR